MKTAEELNAIKAEFEAINTKLSELSPEELEEVCGGGHHFIHPPMPGTPPRLEEDKLGGIIGGFIHRDPPRAELKDEDLGKTAGGETKAGWPQPQPIRPIVSKKCPYKPCSYSSKSQCPYYSEEIGDCNK